VSDDVKVTVLPYKAPRKKSYAATNKATARYARLHQEHLDSLMHQPPGEEEEEHMSETEILFRQAQMKLMPHFYPIDK
jgi:hypothetical protein